MDVEDALRHGCRMLEGRNGDALVGLKQRFQPDIRGTYSVEFMKKIFF